MAEPLRNIIDAGWADALEPVADQIAAMGENCRRISVGLKATPSAAKVGRV